MRTYKKIHAFTLVEFSISMTISTTIVGLLLLSFFFMIKWHHKHYQQLLDREVMYEFVTIFRQDLYNFDKIIHDSVSLSLTDNFKEVEYYFAKSLITRRSQSVIDTFQLKNVNYKRQLLEETELGLNSVEIELVTSGFDTLLFRVPVLKSTMKDLNISYAN